MTHLFKMLKKNTSLPWFVVFSERLSCPRQLTTREKELELVGEKQPATEASGKQKRPIKKYIRKHFHPIVLKRDVLRKVRSVAGISVTPFAVGWAKIDLGTMRLVTYTSADIEDEDMNNTETLAYKEAKKIKELLPESDLYILERFVNCKKSNKEIHFKLMLSSMLAVLLRDNLGPLGEENVHFQNSFVIDYLYKLMVNRERVSAGQVLQRLLTSTLVQQLDDGKHDISVCVEGVTLSAKREIVKSMFFSKSTTRDASAVALFIALSFIISNPIG